MAAASSSDEGEWKEKRRQAPEIKDQQEGIGKVVGDDGRGEGETSQASRSWCACCGRRSDQRGLITGTGSLVLVRLMPRG